MATVIAFDLSLTASGWALAVEGRVQSHGLIVGKEEGVPRLIYLRNRVMEKIEECGARLVVFEDFSYASKDGKAFERAGLAFMIRAELHQDKLSWFAASPMSLKKFIVGTAGSTKNKVTKDLVIKEVYKRWNHDLSDNNIADAVGLAYLGMAAIGEWTPQIEPQRQVLETIWKSNPFLRGMQATAPIVVPTPPPEGHESAW